MTYYLGSVSQGSESVRKGDAGRPAELKRFGSASSWYPKRTCAGSGTSGLETITVSSSITAFASTNSPSRPAISNHSRVN
ncbi:hypothetical protein [Limihaloglobus sulfuriphilus]|uniref:hypothetical protein n=1 Tax=Limihaloglobus sulfuriphilus TaxID=1851148 RepID=UPI0011BAAFE9|nr:hypothetical protein [Limihaloglobus sulfuriphilus]